MATHKLYGPLIENILDGTVDIGAHTFKVALMSSDFNLDQDHQVWASVSTHEITSTDYTPGGEELDITGSTYGSRVTTIQCDAETVFSTQGTISAHHAVVYESTGGNLVSAVDFGGEEASVDGEFKITWQNDELFKITVSA